MNTQLNFVNREELNPIAFTVLGASVKEEDSCIGFFGSGLKYGIAVMLRHNVEFTIKTHGKEYKFTTEERDFRGTAINLILCNGNDLGYTTEFGKTWTLEQAFRELYCNTLDEGGTVELGGEVCSANQTVISVDDHRMNDQFHARHSNFLFESKPIYAFDQGQIHTSKGEGNKKMFFKGVKTQEFNSEMMYDYNVTTKLDLTEDRTLKYTWQWCDEVAVVLSQLTDKAMIKKVLTAPKFSFEHDLDYSQYSIKNWGSEEFMAIAKTLHEKGKLTNSSMRSILNELHPVELEDSAKPLDKEEEEMVAQAYKTLEEAGYYCQGFPLVKFVSKDGNALGQAKDGKIFIEAKTFKLGPLELTATILEEFFHLKGGYADMTRQFQSFLFDELVKQISAVNDLKEKLNYSLA
jgi:hypothetical protein